MRRSKNKNIMSLRSQNIGKSVRNICYQSIGNFRVPRNNFHIKWLASEVKFFFWVKFDVRIGSNRGIKSIIYITYFLPNNLTKEQEKNVNTPVSFVRNVTNFKNLKKKKRKKTVFLHQYNEKTVFEMSMTGAMFDLFLHDVVANLFWQNLANNWHFFINAVGILKTDNLHLISNHTE